MLWLQEFIHNLSVGPGVRYFKTGLITLAVLLLFIGFNWRWYRNFSTPEAMDAAQVARNLAEGRGFTTQFVRPLSIYLVKQRHEARFGPASPAADPARLRGDHPDLANPPVWPVVLAGLMKVLPFEWEIGPPKPFWSKGGRFWRYQPDFIIAIFGELLFGVVIVMTFFLARQLFDPGVAWLSAVLLLGCEHLWSFSASGLPTMLLMIIFLGLVWCLMGIEREARAPRWPGWALPALAAGAGLLVALGMLTRYSFGWLLLPVLVFLILFTGAHRARLCLLATAVFCVAVAPWLYRNYQISGLPFGTATYAVVEGTGLFPENRLQRSLEPNLRTPEARVGTFVFKLINNSRLILRNEVPRLGGSWVTALFLTGLLLGFRNPAIRRLRYFLVGSLALLVVVQALGRTEFSEDFAVISSENLLVLLVPLIFVYGTSLFLLLLDQMNLLFRGLRPLIIGLFTVLVSIPMIVIFLLPPAAAVVYPPYYPPVIQQICRWMRPDELMMSDVPWAVAWYGRRQCMWTTLDAQQQFFAVNDYLKPVRALYLTPQTMDARFLSQWVRAGEHSWGSFILESMLRKEIPTTFPLRVAPAGFLPEQLFLTDWERWRAEEIIGTPTAQPAEPKPQ
jgi:4-amino-4-deoxy-L-arabinose transferase-like glycosyltransferase